MSGNYRECAPKTILKPTLVGKGMNPSDGEAVGPVHLEGYSYPSKRNSANRKATVTLNTAIS